MKPTLTNHIFSKKSLLTITLISGCLTACQSVPPTPVMQRANATYETTGFGKSKNKALDTALTSAKKTCGLRKPIVIKDEFKYNGVLGEKAGRMVEQVGSVAGAILGTGSPNLARDDDYEYNIMFKCQ